MLDFTSTTPTAIHQPGKIRRRHVSITGHSLAKARRHPRERADLAAAWVLGSLTIEPTVTLAAKVFGVCPALIHDEIAVLEATTTATPAIDRVWSGMSTGERDSFVQGHLSQVWDALDHATAA